MVSIVLVTYNRAKRLKLSIQDILNQTFKDFELIICDDCSTDATESVCRTFAAKDNRIKYYRHDSNLQMPANCNFGIQKSIYPYIAILHDGDRFKPDLIEQWYNAISKNDSVGFVFNSIGETDESENTVAAFQEFKEGLVPKDYLLKKVFFRRWHFDSPVWGEAMVKKELIEQFGFLKKRYSFYADVDLWMDILHSHDAYYCIKTLITGPSKRLQPRLFDDDLIKEFLYLFRMQIAHRKKAFKSQPLTMLKELSICWGQALINLNYRLLLLVKNFSFRSFVKASKLLKRSFIFFASWIIILLLYPLLYPLLKGFTFIKQLNSRPMLANSMKAFSLLVEEVLR
jgi:glycosyltransferase involved in cell wall biosynthesis